MDQEEEKTVEELLVEAYDDIIRGAIEDRPADVQDALKAVLDQKIGERLDALRVEIPMNTFDVPVSNTEYGDDDEWEVEDENDDEVEVAEEEVEEDEETEQLDEISKKTLASYVSGAFRDRGHSFGSGARDERRKIDDMKRSYDNLGAASNLGSGLDSGEYNSVYNARSSIYDRMQKAERKHEDKNLNRRRGVENALNRLQGRFAGKTVKTTEPEKTPTGRDSKTKTVTKHTRVYKDYKGE
jgi:hypothetical protein